MELETKLQEMERRRIDQEAQREADREKSEERVKFANDAKEAAEREALVLRYAISSEEPLQLKKIKCIIESHILKLAGTSYLPYFDIPYHSDVCENFLNTLLVYSNQLSTK